MLTKYCAEVKAERAINEANMSILTKVTEEETKHIEVKHTNDENNTSVTSTKDADVDEGDKSANATADSLKHNEDDESAVSKVDEKKTGAILKEIREKMKKLQAWSKKRTKILIWMSKTPWALMSLRTAIGKTCS